MSERRRITPGKKRRKEDVRGKKDKRVDQNKALIKIEGKQRED